MPGSKSITSTRPGSRSHLLLAHAVESARGVVGEAHAQVVPAGGNGKAAVGDRGAVARKPGRRRDDVGDGSPVEIHLHAHRGAFAGAILQGAHVGGELREFLGRADAARDLALPGVVERDPDERVSRRKRLEGGRGREVAQRGREGAIEEGLQAVAKCRVHGRPPRRTRSASLPWMRGASVNASEKQSSGASPCFANAGCAASTIFTEPQA